MQNVVIQKIDLYRDFAAGVYLSEAQNSYSPLHTVNMYTVFLFTQGGGEGGESWTREKVSGETVKKSGSKIPTWLTVSPVYNLW